MIIAMWSGPRNLSTAMMRSFGSRADFTVWDEPFFAPFLKATGKAHPGREETLAAHETDAETVANLCTMSTSKPFYFQKHMPHHMLPEFPMDWTAQATHFFLLRHPQRVIASYAKSRAAFNLEDLGFVAQHRLWLQLGRPPVIHSEIILGNPELALRALCEALHIPFDAAMLSWRSGPRKEDGAWAPWWYETVWQSTGFGGLPAALPAISSKYQTLLAACLPAYEALAAQAIKV